MRRLDSRSRRSGCRGLTALEGVLSMAVFFPIAMALYYLAQASVGEMYQLIATMVGSPYL